MGDQNELKNARSHANEYSPGAARACSVVCLGLPRRINDDSHALSAA
jgi:hypothetical protein